MLTKSEARELYLKSLQDEEFSLEVKKRLDKLDLRVYHTETWLDILANKAIFLSRPYPQTLDRLNNRASCECDQHEIIGRTRNTTILRLTLDDYNYLDKYVIPRDFCLQNELIEVEYYGTSNPDTP